MNGLEVIKQGTRWRVGNGNLIHIWDDKWMSMPTTYMVISPPPPPPKLFDDFPMVSSLIDRDTRRWKADLVKSIFLHFEANTILNIPLCYNLPKDKIIWVGNRKGEFTVKSAYYIALKMIGAEDEGESSIGDGRNALWKRLCYLKIPAKTKIFAWKACMDRLPTAVNLKKRGIDIDELCLCCERGPESISHSLITCGIARRVWDY